MKFWQADKSDHNKKKLIPLKLNSKNIKIKFNSQKK